LEIQVEEIESWKLALRVKSRAAVVEDEMERLYGRYSRGAEIPGFRKGKAPREVIKAKYGRMVETEAVEKTIPHLYRQAIEEKGIRPITQAEIDEVIFEPGQELSFRATFEIVPEFEVKDYEGISIKSRAHEPSREKIEERLEQLRQLNASLLPVDREARKGDHVVVDYTILDEEKKPIPDGSVSNYSLPLGQVGQKELDEGLVGVRPGDVREIVVEFPREFGDTRLAGRKLPVRIKTREVKERKTHELNEEFARDLGAASLKELSERVAEELSRETERRNRAEWEKEVVDGLIERNKFEPPGSLVSGYLEEMREKDQGLAAWLARRAILLDKLVLALEVSALDEDVKARVERIAEDLRVAPEKIRETLEKTGRIEQVKTSIRREKVLNYLIEHANKK
jgi:trigger factor